jgi:hypothetical protein
MTVFDFTTFAVLMLLIIATGTKANESDQQFMERILEIKNNAHRSLDLAKSGQIFEIDGQIDILTVENGGLVSARGDKEILSNNGYVNMSGIMSERLIVLEEKASFVQN